MSLTVTLSTLREQKVNEPLFHQSSLILGVISIMGARVYVFVSRPKHRKVISIVHRKDRVHI